MKPSIAMTLVVTAAIFSFVSGYSIGAHSDQAAASKMANQSTAAKAASPSGGYGAPSSAASPGYGAPSPGYGQ